MSQPIVEQSGDDWTVRIDATHAPEYVLLVHTGAASPEAMSQSIDALIAVMDALVGPGKLFYPLIIDLRQQSSAGLSMPAASRAIRKIMRRMNTSALVFASDASDLVFGFFRMLVSARPDIYVTDSVEEALEKLRGG